MARAPGVGPKLAARIVAELKDKAGAFGDVEFGASPQRDSSGRQAAGRGDAISALVNLGYGRPQAATAIAPAEGARRRPKSPR